jgi:hypothetical protein
MVLGDVQMAAPALSRFSRDSDVSALQDFPFLLGNRGVFAVAASEHPASRHPGIAEPRTCTRPCLKAITKIGGKRLYLSRQCAAG